MEALIGDELSDNNPMLKTYGDVINTLKFPEDVGCKYDVKLAVSDPNGIKFTNTSDDDEESSFDKLSADDFSDAIDDILENGNPLTKLIVSIWNLKEEEIKRGVNL